MATLAAVCLLAVAAVGRAFYLPGVVPYSFKNGEEVVLKVNKLRLGAC
jgi:hypothetical protein